MTLKRWEKSYSNKLDDTEVTNQMTDVWGFKDKYKHVIKILYT